MPINIRTNEEITNLVAEAKRIDKEIVAQLAAEDPVNSWYNIYDREDPETNATEAQTIAAADRIQRIISTLIEEESRDNQTTRQEAKWDANTNELALIKDDVDKLRKLADPDEIGTGIRTVQPWSEISFALLYKKFIEEGAVLELDVEITEEQRQNAIERYKTYIDSFISNFNQYRGF